MIPAADSQTDFPALARAVAERIHQRTSRRLRELCVDAAEDRVLVQGRAQSYYVKQLALAACREVLADRAALELVHEIDVTP